MYDSIALVGATGAVGTIMREMLAERKFPHKSIKFLASERSAGSKIDFDGKINLLPPHIDISGRKVGA